MNNVNESIMHKLTKKCIKSMQNITKATNRHSVFDAYNDKCVIEYKARRGPKYPDTLIERKKYDSNINLGKVFVYAVAVQGRIYYFDISRLTREGYDFNWGDLRCPQSTDFKRKRWISKRVGYLTFDQADAVVDVERGVRIQ